MVDNSVVIGSDDKELIIAHLYTVEDYLTFRIKVTSGEFSGASNFCLSKEKVLSIIEMLTNMHEVLGGGCKINDSDSDAFIAFEMEKYGHLEVYGQIGGSHEDHFMKFDYWTDQTILLNMVQALKRVL